MDGSQALPINAQNFSTPSMLLDLAWLGLAWLGDTHFPIARLPLWKANSLNYLINSIDSSLLQSDAVEKIVDKEALRD